MKIQESLLHIQAALKAPKNQYNKFGGYKYRSAEDILEAVKPIAHKYGCVIILNDDIQQVGDRIYVKASAMVMDGEGHTITSSAFAREELDKKGMDASQITGSASSYARKYALNGLLCIDDTKDADATNTHGKAATTQVAPTPTDNGYTIEMAREELRNTSTSDALRLLYRKAKVLNDALLLADIESKGKELIKEGK